MHSPEPEPIRRNQHPIVDDSFARINVAETKAEIHDHSHDLILSTFPQSPSYIIPNPVVIGAGHDEIKSTDRALVTEKIIPKKLSGENGYLTV